jgi:hypothetical protein
MAMHINPVTIATEAVDLFFFLIVPGDGPLNLRSLFIGREGPSLSFQCFFTIS